MSRALGTTDGQEPIIISARGYGHHCGHVHRVDLDVVCAMHAVAAEHGVSLTTVGNWIDDDQGLAGQVEPATLPERFRGAYIGRYTDRDAYVGQRMNERGWTQAITQLGIEAYFDAAAYQRDVFSYEVIAIDPGDAHRRERSIEVFRRAPCTQP